MNVDYEVQANHFREERDQLAEEMNQISMLLFGHKKGSFSEIMKIISKQQNRENK